MIETARLTLRPWVEADREAFVTIVGDPEVGFWLGGTLSRDEADAAFDRMQAFWDEHGYGWLAIVRRSDASLVGRVVCRQVPAEWGHPMGDVVELGWALAREAWGHGYASESAAAALERGFEQFAVSEIYAWTARTNVRSQGVMQRIGMVHRPDHDFEHPDLAADDPLRPHVVYLIGRAAAQ